MGTGSSGRYGLAAEHGTVWRLALVVVLGSDLDLTADEAEGQGGARGDGGLGVALEAGRKRAGIDDRVAPLVQGDRLGEKLGAGAAARAVDGVDQEFHC
jgi:hypothetical protein